MEITEEERKAIEKMRQEQKQQKEKECQHQWQYIETTEIETEKKGIIGKNKRKAYIFICPKCIQKKLISKD